LPLVLDVVVPGEISATNITTIKNAFKQSPVTSVDISSTNIIELGENSFYECYDLQTIELNGIIEIINDNAFAFCESLSISSVPDSVYYFGAFCYAGCESITSFVIPESLSATSRGCFALCINLQSTNLKNLQLVEYETFLNCPITEIIIGENVGIYDNQTMGIYNFKPAYENYSQAAGTYTYDINEDKWLYAE
jgi:hypothetical protein